MHARAEEGDARDRRFRMRVLHHEHVPEIEGEAQGMEIELLEMNGIALSARGSSWLPCSGEAARR
jgi:hypothetical protein